MSRHVMLEAGGKFGDLRVVKELGRGGMGAVYLVHNEVTGADFAAKILFPEAEIKNHDDAVGRFLREAEIAMTVNHPNVVKVYEVGRDPETRLGFMLMDYLPGGSLHDRLMERLWLKKGPFRVDEAVGLVRQIADALVEAERHGVVHRDIKPHNILFGADGRPRLSDLGIAKQAKLEKKALTMTNMVVGTPAYMSPEQMMDSKHVDIRSDIYSLGIVLWQMLAGELPNAEESVSEMLRHACQKEPIPDILLKRPKLPRAIVLMLRKMTSPRVETRFQHPQEILDFLDSYASPKRINRQLLFAGCAVALAIAALTTALLYRLASARQQDPGEQNQIRPLTLKRCSTK